MPPKSLFQIKLKSHGPASTTPCGSASRDEQGPAQVDISASADEPTPLFSRTNGNGSSKGIELRAQGNSAKRRRVIAHSSAFGHGDDHGHDDDNDEIYSGDDTEVRPNRSTGKMEFIQQFGTTSAHNNTRANAEPMPETFISTGNAGISSKKPRSSYIEAMLKRKTKQNSGGKLQTRADYSSNSLLEEIRQFAPVPDVHALHEDQKMEGYGERLLQSMGFSEQDRVQGFGDVMETRPHRLGLGASIKAPVLASEIQTTNESQSQESPHKSANS